jgi:hypothetical protein
MSDSPVVIKKSSLEFWKKIFKLFRMRIEKVSDYKYWTLKSKRLSVLQNFKLYAYKNDEDYII